MKKNKDKNDYSEEYIKKHRKFPVKNTVAIVICIVAQIVSIFLAVTAEADKPQDIIQNYQVTVEPLEDGSLDIEYKFLWKAVSMEDLTWVEIGVPNYYFSVYKDSVSSSIKEISDISEDNYTGVRLDFNRAYRGGETLEFSFKINQEQMLCQNDNGYFYEFIPCWFNSTPVEKFEFRWKNSDTCFGAENAELKNGYYTKTGTLKCGEFEKMVVSYSPDTFPDAEVADYESFDESLVYNELEANRIINIIFFCVIAVVLLGFEIYLLDSHVSYIRGRGFISSYGHPVYTYGYQNPKYVKAYNRAHAPSHTHSRGGFRSGGCACACACACAGGGRAGCSQKDTFSTVKSFETQQKEEVAL
ncbi:MAG: hypothetical protein IJZ88_00025 [Clostridia bacterium]|nr:hypothetical protein [Clostridia bacterium]